MIISLIVAMGKNRVIGNNGQIPWKMPADMAYFKEITSGKPIIMGRKTHESIGKPLPNRRNIILTRNTHYRVDGCEVVTSLRQLFAKLKNHNSEVMVIGGEEIYQLFLETGNVDKIYLTEIEEEFEGNAYFPKFDTKSYRQTKEHHEKDDTNPYNYNFIVYEKI